MDDDNRRELLAFAEGNYEVHDFIKEVNERADQYRADVDLRAQMDRLNMRQPTRLDPLQDVYPKKGSYTFQEFAGPVFEFGGYGDMTLIDPYTLRRLWVSQQVVGELGVYDAMRRVIDLAEATGFLRDEENRGDPLPSRESLERSAQHMEQVDEARRENKD
jgi:hypothetical protein